MAPYVPNAVFLFLAVLGEIAARIWAANVSTRMYDKYDRLSIPTIDRPPRHQGGGKPLFDKCMSTGSKPYKNIANLFDKVPGGQNDGQSSTWARDNGSHSGQVIDQAIEAEESILDEPDEDTDSLLASEGFELLEVEDMPPDDISSEVEIPSLDG